MHAPVSWEKAALCKVRSFAPNLIGASPLHFVGLVCGKLSRDQGRWQGLGRSLPYAPRPDSYPMRLWVRVSRMVKEMARPTATTRLMKL